MHGLVPLHDKDKKCKAGTHLEVAYTGGLSLGGDGFGFSVCHSAMISWSSRKSGIAAQQSSKSCHVQTILLKRNTTVRLFSWMHVRFRFRPLQKSLRKFPSVAFETSQRSLGSKSDYTKKDLRMCSQDPKHLKDVKSGLRDAPTELSFSFKFKLLYSGSFSNVQPESEIFQGFECGLQDVTRNLSTSRATSRLYAQRNL